MTILFADIVGFTEYAKSRPPEEIVTLLDDVFSSFDDLADKYGLEKIKTIGDAYLAAGGLPEPKSDHAAAVADFALELLDYLDKKRDDGTFDLSVRIGIHSGSVVAGVIGRRKFSYDIWGDTVNLAARLETTSSANRILVSKTTKNLLRDTHLFEEIGEVELKGIGRLETFMLMSRI